MPVAKGPGRRHSSARRAIGALILSMFLGAGPGNALERDAQLGPVTASVTLEPDEPVIGDPMTLVIEVTAEDGVEVLMPDFGEALDRFRIVDFVPRERIDDAGRSVHSQRYSLRAPASGEYLLPAILIEFVDRRPGHDPAPADQDAYELLTESIPFAVASVVPDSATTDLHPPMERLAPRDGTSGPPWPWLLGAIVALAAASPLVYRAWRQLRERSRMRSAYELAREELDALLAGPRPTPEKVDAFFVELSGIVRRYLERRFSVRSPELTTERFLEQVSGSPDLTRTHQDLLRDFLRESDLVKFAHHIPTPGEIDRAVAFARHFVDETREEAPPTGGAPQRVGV